MPRCSGGTSGCRFVKPRTCTSGITVSDHGTSGPGRISGAGWRGEHRQRHVAERVDGARRPGHRVDRPAAGGLEVGDGAGDPPGVGVHEDLGRVGAQALPRPVRAVHPVAVALPGGDPGDMAVPDAERALGERDATLACSVAGIAVDQAHLDGLGAGRRDREPRPVGVDMGTQREDRTRSARICPVAAHGSPSESLFPTTSEPAPSDPGDFVIRMEGVDGPPR